MNFWFFKELVDWTPWETVFRDRGEESWQLFNVTFFKAQVELSIPTFKKLIREGRSPAQPSEDHLVRLKHRREMLRQQK